MVAVAKLVNVFVESCRLQKHHHHHMQCAVTVCSHRYSPPQCRFRHLAKQLASTVTKHRSHLPFQDV